MEVIDLAGDRDLSTSQAEKARALGIPVGSHSHRYFQDIMASLCPNITDLTVNLTIQPSRRWIVSENAITSLFSMPKISKLKLSFGLPGLCQSAPFSGGDLGFDGMLISKVIKDLTVLRELTLANRSAEALITNRFHVESPSFRVLDVQGLTKGVWISCKCPRLERFLCNGFYYGNGSRPATRPLEQTINHPSSGIYFYAGAVPFVGLKKPMIACAFSLASQGANLILPLIICCMGFLRPSCSEYAFILGIKATFETLSEQNYDRLEISIIGKFDRPLYSKYS